MTEPAACRFMASCFLLKSTKVLLAKRHIARVRRVDLCEIYGGYLRERGARPFKEENLESVYILCLADFCIECLRDCWALLS